MLCLVYVFFFPSSFCHSCDTCSLYSPFPTSHYGYLRGVRSRSAVGSFWAKNDVARWLRITDAWTCITSCFVHTNLVVLYYFRRAYDRLLNICWSCSMDSRVIKESKYLRNYPPPLQPQGACLERGELSPTSLENMNTKGDSSYKSRSHERNE